jgi:hypothetical protein
MERIELDQDDFCPNCLSDNISNGDDSNEYGDMQLICHNCSYQWEVPQNEAYNE